MMRPRVQYRFFALEGRPHAVSTRGVSIISGMSIPDYGRCRRQVYSPFDPNAALDAPTNHRGLLWFAIQCSSVGGNAAFEMNRSTQQQRRIRVWPGSFPRGPEISPEFCEMHGHDPKSPTSAAIHIIPSSECRTDWGARLAVCRASSHRSSPAKHLRSWSQEPE